MPSLVKVDHPEQFPLATADRIATRRAELNVTGVGQPRRLAQRAGDSLASGRVVEIRRPIWATPSPKASF